MDIQNILWHQRLDTLTGQAAFTIIFLKAAGPKGGNKNGGGREYDRQTV